MKKFSVSPSDILSNKNVPKDAKVVPVSKIFFNEKMGGVVILSNSANKEYEKTGSILIE